MADSVQNQNDNDDLNELKPVRSRFKKIIYIGTKIALGGAAVVFVAHLLFAPRVMGATRTARLKFEQKRAEIQKQLAEKVQQEIDEKE